MRQSLLARINEQFEVVSDFHLDRAQTRRNIGERRKESVVGRGTLYSEPKVDGEHGLSKPFDDRFGLRWNLIRHDGNSLSSSQRDTELPAAEPSRAYWSR